MAVYIFCIWKICALEINQSISNLLKFTKLKVLVVDQNQLGMVSFGG